MKNYLVQCLFVFLFITFSVRAVFAFEEEHAAHEHGHATLMLVQERDELQLVFKSPAMNIVGFEHQANSPEQHAKIEWAKKSLSDAARLFLVSQNAQCELEHIAITSALLEKDDHNNEHGDHEVDGHEKDGHEVDGHDSHTGDGSHSEFEAEYHFECANISALREVKLALFEIFTSIEEIEVHIITHSGQKLLELDRENVSIKL